MRYITFALAKGRLAKKAMEMLELAGITCEEMKDETSRKLIFEMCIRDRAYTVQDYKLKILEIRQRKE